MVEELTNIINSIEKRYFFTQNPLIRNSKSVNYSVSRPNLEEKFKLELYHQIRISNKFNDFMVEGEIQKQIITNSLIQETQKRLGLKRVKPDLLIHKSQSDNNPKNQILALELKVGNPKQIYFDKDLFKLMIYKSDLKFKNVVFLIVNCKEHLVRKKLENYKKSNYCILKNTNGIYVLLKEEFGKPLINVKL